MIVFVSCPRQKYRFISNHLFKGNKEQGCFLLVNTHFDSGVVNLQVKEVHLVQDSRWDHHSEFHLELKEEEKVKIMLLARKSNLDLIECHSHRSIGVARFSHTDLHGLEDFIRYVWWKLPGRIYGALVWTENDVAGQVWLPKKSIPLTVSEIRITN